MSLDFEDFESFLREKGIFVEYTNYVIRRYGPDVTIKLLWRDFNHKDILNSTVVWNDTLFPSNWPEYNKQWAKLYDSGVKPTLSRCRSIW